MIDYINKYLKSFNIEKIQLYLFGIYLLLIYIFEENGIMLKVSSLLLLVFCIIEFINIIKSKKIKYNISIVFVFLFACFCGLSVFWAVDKTLALEKAKTMFLLSIFLLFLFSYFKRIDKGIEKVTKILLIVGLLFALYILCYYGPINYFKQLFDGVRIGREIENVNSIGNKMAVTFVICIFSAIFLKNKKCYWLAILPFIISIGTGSRKVIFLMVISVIIFVIYYLRDRKISKKSVKKIAGIVFLIAVVLTIILQFVDIPFVSTQVNRMKGLINGMFGSGKPDHATSLRMSYINAGIVQFKKTPLVGIGIDNARIINADYTYLHNNFIELLASVGIIGFILYYATYFIILSKFFKNIKNLSKYQVLSFAIFITMFILEYGMVTYYTKNTYIYILMCYLVLDMKCIQFDFSKILNTVKSPKVILLKMLDIGFFNWLSDEKFLKLKYKLVVGKNLNLDNPQSFNEKMQWLKLNDRKDIYTIMVDKYEAKEYVSKIIGDEYIIPTLGIYNRFDDINFEKLPNQFVIKCTHDSGGIVICRNKSEFNIKEARKTINKYLKRNYFYVGREWPYKNVKPRIIVEKFIENSDGEQLRDYKFFCFNGVPKLMYLSEGLENHATARMSFYDMNFKLTRCKRSDYKQLDYTPERPKTFDKMKEYSRILSKNIPHLRVDWYEINGHLYFGELTFTTCSGFIPFDDEKWDYKIGNMLKTMKK